MGSYNPPATPLDPVDVEAAIVAMLGEQGYLLTTDGSNVVAIASEYGNGTNFLKMCGDGYARWTDIGEMVEYVSGGLNRWVMIEMDPMTLPTVTYDDWRKAGAAMRQEEPKQAPIPELAMVAELVI